MASAAFCGYNPECLQEHLGVVIIYERVTGCGVKNKKQVRLYN